MDWTIEFAPLVPETLLWSAAAMALVLAAAVLVRRSRGAVLRVLSLAALLAAIANPTFRQEERDPLANIVLVVVDKSASQKIDGRDARSKAIRAALEKRLARIPGLQVRWLTSTGARAGTKSGTYLFTDLNRGLANIPADRLAGIIAITDGQIHDVPKSAKGHGFTAPVHALLTGRKREFDRRIKVLEAPRYGIVGGSRDITLEVMETGRKQRGGRIALLKVRREGKGEVLIRAPVGRKVRIPFLFPHAGANIVEITLTPEPGELTKVNNRVVLQAEGVRENLRVLLVSGEPHAGERTWRNLLKSDAAVDLVHFTILRPPEKQDGTPIHQLSLIAFPTRELFSEKINDFDLIIFDRYQRRGVLPLLYLDNVARYVEEHGGAVLVAAGENYARAMSLYRTPLSAILPAEPTGRIIERAYRARITSQGARHPVTRGLPGAGTGSRDPRWGRWFRLVEATPSSGHVVMKGPEDRPLLVLDRRGKGRVALLLSDHAWLWARGFEGGGPHTVLLRRLAHWLMKQPDLEEEYLSARANGLALVIERRSMAEHVPPVTVTAPDGGNREVRLSPKAPGLWRQTVAVENAGLYQLRSGRLTALVHVGATGGRELAEMTATEALLAPVMEATGGGAFWPAESRAKAGLSADDVSETTASDVKVRVPRIAMLRSARVLHGAGWLGLLDREASITRGIRLTPLFTGFAALGLLLGLIALAWYREGR